MDSLHPLLLPLFCAQEPEVIEKEINNIINNNDPSLHSTYNIFCSKSSLEIVYDKFEIIMGHVTQIEICTADRGEIIKCHQELAQLYIKFLSWFSKLDDPSVEKFSDDHIYLRGGKCFIASMNETVLRFLLQKVFPTANINPFVFSSLAVLCRELFCSRSTLAGALYTSIPSPTPASFADLFGPILHVYSFTQTTDLESFFSTLFHAIAIGTNRTLLDAPSTLPLSATELALKHDVLFDVLDRPLEWMVRFLPKIKTLEVLKGAVTTVIFNFLKSLVPTVHWVTYGVYGDYFSTVVKNVIAVIQQEESLSNSSSSESPNLVVEVIRVLSNILALMVGSRSGNNFTHSFSRIEDVMWHMGEEDVIEDEDASFIFVKVLQYVKRVGCHGNLPQELGAVLERVAPVYILSSSWCEIILDTLEGCGVQINHVASVVKMASALLPHNPSFFASPRSARIVVDCFRKVSGSANASADCYSMLHLFIDRIVASQVSSQISQARELFVDCLLKNSMHSIPSFVLNVLRASTFAELNSALPRGFIDDDVFGTITDYNILHHLVASVIVDKLEQLPCDDDDDDDDDDDGERGATRAGLDEVLFKVGTDFFGTVRQRHADVLLLRLVPRIDDEVECLGLLDHYLANEEPAILRDFFTPAIVDSIFSIIFKVAYGTGDMYSDWANESVLGFVDLMSSVIERLLPNHTTEGGERERLQELFVTEKVRLCFAAAHEVCHMHSLSCDVAKAVVRICDRNVKAQRFFARGRRLREE